MNLFLRPDWPAPARVRALVTTRTGGTSRAPFASLNLATHVGDDPGTVAANRAWLHEAAALPGSPRWLDQTHGTLCLEADRVVEPAEADAAFTRTPGVVCAVLTADCLPVLLCDAAGTTVAAVHAGWRGLAGGVIDSTLRRLPRDREWLAWIGPGIGPAAYRVGEELRERFISLDAAHEAAFTHEPDGWHCDLARLATRQLEAAGVRSVHRHPGCTHAEAGQFFSHRRDGQTGRFASLIWLA